MEKPYYSQTLPTGNGVCITLYPFPSCQRSEFIGSHGFLYFFPAAEIFNRIDRNRPEVLTPSKDLIENKEYHLIEMYKSETMYGTALIALIKFNDRVGKIYMPEQFKKGLTDSDVRRINSVKHSLIYLGPLGSSSRYNLKERFGFENQTSYHDEIKVSKSMDYRENSEIPDEKDSGCSVNY